MSQQQNNSNDRKIVSALNAKAYRSKSEMIRDLFYKEGKTRSEIAKGEGLLYQHVRNVLVNHEDQETLRKLREKSEG